MDFIHTCVLHDNPQHYRVLRQKFLVVRGMVQLPPGNKEVVLTPPLKVSFRGMVQLPPGNKEVVLNPPHKVSFRGMVQLPSGKKEVVLTPPHKVSFRGMVQLPNGNKEVGPESSSQGKFPGNGAVTTW